MIVVTAKPFETREEVPRVRIPELEASEDIDPSLEAVSRPHAEDEAQLECIGSTREVHSLDSKFSSGSRSLNSRDLGCEFYLVYFQDTSNM